MKRDKRPRIVAKAYDKRGRLLSIGYNSYVRTHPLQAEYAKRVGRPEAIYLHAELAALLKARTNVVHKLVVTRYNRAKKPLLAAPCPACQLALKEWGVKEVEHT
jgi:deoxycytidylate deaminase